MLEGGALSAIMVLLAKQMHLQKDVGADFAVEPGEMRERRISRVRRVR